MKRWSSMSSARTLAILLVLSTALLAEGAARCETPISDGIRTLRVPEVRGREGTRTIEVAYLELAGNAPGTPLLVLLGGPGESILEYETVEGARAELAPFLALGDVVVVEQRGVGASRPALDCEPAHPALEEPLSHEALQALLRDATARCRDRFGIGSQELEGYTTREMVEDVESVRRALGYERIRISGGSFGATVAYQFLREHGAVVERAVLTQFLAPDANLVLPAHLDAALAKIGDRLGEGLTGDIRAVLAHLRREPVEVALEGERLVIGAYDLEIVTALALRRTRYSGMLPALFSQMRAGEFGFVGGVAYSFFRREIPVNLSVLALDCALGWSSERRRLFDAQVEGSLLGRGGHAPFPDICADLPHGDIGEGWRRPGDIQTPTLVVLGELDARANPESAAAALAGTSARISVVQNATHDLGTSAVATAAGQLAALEAGFLESGAWPPSTIELGSGGQ
jgi:pimeloyl-ACP methyl ester carboxylesterase